MASTPIKLSFKSFIDNKYPKDTFIFNLDQQKYFGSGGTVTYPWCNQLAMQPNKGALQFIDNNIQLLELIRTILHTIYYTYSDKVQHFPGLKEQIVEQIGQYGSYSIYAENMANLNTYRSNFGR